MSGPESSRESRRAWAALLLTIAVMFGGGMVLWGWNDDGPDSWTGWVVWIEAVAVVYLLAYALMGWVQR